MSVRHQFKVSKVRLLASMLIFVLSGYLMFFAKQTLAAEQTLSIANISAVALKAKYTELNELLLNNQFNRELYLNSKESSNDLKGEIYAVVDYPFDSVNAALNNSEHWCDALILHVNIKYCAASGSGTNTILTVNMGKKNEQPLAQTYSIDFNYHEVIKTSDYFAIELKAENGPLSTHDYRIWVEATKLKDGRTFLHFTYSYAFGLAGSLAMQGYLATGGRNKIGFTVTGKNTDGQANYIHGVRGVVERNTMRYYLAIDSYLSALTTLPKNQLEKRLQHWYDSTELYTLQLHEVERDDYLIMKRKEYKRQQAAL